MLVDVVSPYPLARQNFSSSLIPMLQREILHPGTLAEASILKKNEEFFRDLKKAISAGILVPSLKPLTELLSGRVSLSPDRLREGLWKRNGHLVRLFSDESWEEWTENRTSLGKLVGVYSDYVAGEIGKDHLSKRLDGKLIAEANEEARQLFKPSVSKEVFLSHCKTSLFAGALASFKIHHPGPIAISSLNCFEGVFAQRGSPSKAAANRYGNRRDQILADNAKRRGDAGIKDPPRKLDELQKQDKLDLADYLRKKLMGEISDQVQDTLARELMDGTAWIDFLISGLDYVLDVIGVTTPMNQLENALAELEDAYWMRVVMPEYVKIFPTPDVLAKPENVLKYTIKTMRDKLNSNGYNILLGTPVEHIQTLKKGGTCERPFCSKEDL